MDFLPEEEPQGLVGSVCQALDLWYWNEARVFVQEQVFASSRDLLKRPRVLVSLDGFEQTAQAYQDAVKALEIVGAELDERNAQLERLRIGYYRELSHLRNELRRTKLRTADNSVLTFEKYMRNTEIYFFDLRAGLDDELVVCMRDAVKELARRKIGDKFLHRLATMQVASPGSPGALATDDPEIGETPDLRVKDAMETSLLRGVSVEELIAKFGEVLAEAQEGRSPALALRIQEALSTVLEKVRGKTASAADELRGEDKIRRRLKTVEFQNSELKKDRDEARDRHAKEVQDLVARLDTLQDQLCRLQDKGGHCVTFESLGEDKIVIDIAPVVDRPPSRVATPSESTETLEEEPEIVTLAEEPPEIIQTENAGSQTDASSPFKSERELRLEAELKEKQAEIVGIQQQLTHVTEECEDAKAELLVYHSKEPERPAAGAQLLQSERTAAGAQLLQSERTVGGTQSLQLAAAGAGPGAKTLGNEAQFFARWLRRKFGSIKEGFGRLTDAASLDFDGFADLLQSSEFNVSLARRLFAAFSDASTLRVEMERLPEEVKIENIAQTELEAKERELERRFFAQEKKALEKEIHVEKELRQQFKHEVVQMLQTAEFPTLLSSASISLSAPQTFSADAAPPSPNASTWQEAPVAFPGQGANADRNGQQTGELAEESAFQRALIVSADSFASASISQEAEQGRPAGEGQPGIPAANQKVLKILQAMDTVELRVEIQGLAKKLKLTKEQLTLVKNERDAIGSKAVDYLCKMRELQRELLKAQLSVNEEKSARQNLQLSHDPMDGFGFDADDNFDVERSLGDTATFQGGGNAGEFVFDAPYVVRAKLADAKGVDRWKQLYGDGKLRDRKKKALEESRIFISQAREMSAQQAVRPDLNRPGDIEDPNDISLFLMTGSSFRSADDTQRQVPLQTSKIFHQRPKHPTLGLAINTMSTTFMSSSSLKKAGNLRSTANSTTFQFNPANAPSQGEAKQPKKQTGKLKASVPLKAFSFNPKPHADKSPPLITASKWTK